MFFLTAKDIQQPTTHSGFGYGVIKNNEAVIPFEYDNIIEYGEYFVALKFDKGFDIYDKDFNKASENAGYILRRAAYGSKGSQLPNGYFPIEKPNDDYDSVKGIINYKGDIIVEPVFGSNITLLAYEAMGSFIDDLFFWSSYIFSEVVIFLLRLKRNIL